MLGRIRAMLSHPTARAAAAAAVIGFGLKVLTNIVTELQEEIGATADELTAISTRLDQARQTVDVAGCGDTTVLDDDPERGPRRVYCALGAAHGGQRHVDRSGEWWPMLPEPEKADAED